MFALLAASAGLVGPAGGDVVTQRWGIGGYVQHAKTLAYEDAGKAGTLMRFDLSALPAKAQIHRARLLMRRAGGYAGSFEVLAGERAAGQPLAPVPPYCRWFDVTAAVRRWAAGQRGRFGLGVRGSGYDPKATVLEIAFEGSLRNPPKQVGEVKALHRAGQVFVTFREIEDLSEGQQRYPWGHLIGKLRGYRADGPVPKDDKRELRYRVYRHDAPITAETLGAAELLAEVVSGSGFNTRIVRRIWQGENVPSKLDDKFVAVRLGIEPGKPLAPGVGLYVHTVRRPGRAWYAVLTTVNGVENTTDLSGAVVGPVDQKPGEPAPVLQAETFKEGAYKRKIDDLVTRRYCYWAVPPQSPRPIQYGLVIQYHPNRIGDRPAPLEVSHGKGHTVEPCLERWQRRDAILLALSDDPELGFYVGSNNCHQTLKSFRQGTWSPWTWNRAAKWIAWVRKNYKIDDQQIYCYGSHWGLWELRHPEIFSAFIGWGSGELTKGFVDWSRARGVWGPPEAHAGKPDQENPYVMCNFTRFVSDPARRLPFQMLASCTGSHTGEMSYPSLPAYRRALMDAKQPFVACIGKASWGWKVPMALREFQAGRLKIRRDQSKPAFANCSIDDNPGCGDIRSGDPVGVLNGYLLWDTETILDRPDRWEMTVYLHKSAPRPECTVDLTARHCQRFKPRPGAKLSWTNALLPKPAAGKLGPGEKPKPLAPSKVVQRGSAEADKLGLVTLKGLKVTTGRHRITILAK